MQFVSDWQCLALSAAGLKLPVMVLIIIRSKIMSIIFTNDIHGKISDTGVLALSVQQGWFDDSKTI